MLTAHQTQAIEAAAAQLLQAEAAAGSFTAGSLQSAEAQLRSALTDSVIRCFAALHAIAEAPSQAVPVAGCIPADWRSL